MLATPETPNFDDIIASYDLELDTDNPEDEELLTLFEEKAERIPLIPLMGGTGNKSRTTFGKGTADDWEDWED